MKTINESYKATVLEYFEVDTYEDFLGVLREWHCESVLTSGDVEMYLKEMFTEGYLAGVASCKGG